MVPHRMSSASLATFPEMLVRDFQDGHEVDQVLLVRGAEARSKRDGGEYLRLTLADRTGSVVAMVWDDVERLRVLCPAACAPPRARRSTCAPAFASTRATARRSTWSGCTSQRPARSPPQTCSTA